MQELKSTETTPSMQSSGIPLRQKEEVPLEKKLSMPKLALNKPAFNLPKWPKKATTDSQDATEKRAVKSHYDNGDSSTILGDHETLESIVRVHYWIFLVPLLWLLLGLYLWLGALAKGPFNLLFVLDIFELPARSKTLMANDLYSQMALGFATLQDKMPEGITHLLSTTYLHPRKWLSYGVLIYAAYRLIRAAIYFITTEILLTNRRLVIKSGLIKPEIIDIAPKQISFFQIKMGIVSRFLNVGRLIIQTNGGYICELPAIPRLKTLRKSLLDLGDPQDNAS